MAALMKVTRPRRRKHSLRSRVTSSLPLRRKPRSRARRIANEARRMPRRLRGR